MKRNLWFFKVIVLMMILFSAVQCVKEKAPSKSVLTSSVPSCIREKIDLYLQQPKSDPPAEVWRYSFHGSLVYYFPNRAQIVVDGCSELYDGQCNLLCMPDGCFTGNGDGRCPDFFSQRTNEVLLWRDNR